MIHYAYLVLLKEIMVSVLKDVNAWKSTRGEGGIANTPKFSGFLKIFTSGLHFLMNRSEKEEAEEKVPASPLCRPRSAGPGLSRPGSSSDGSQVSFLISQEGERERPQILLQGLPPTLTIGAQRHLEGRAEIAALGGLPS